MRGFIQLLNAVVVGLDTSVYSHGMCKDVLHRWEGEALFE